MFSTESQWNFFYGWKFMRTTENQWERSWKWMLFYWHSVAQMSNWKLIGQISLKFNGTLVLLKVIGREMASLKVNGTTAISERKQMWYFCLLPVAIFKHWLFKLHVDTHVAQCGPKSVYIVLYIYAVYIQCKHVLCGWVDR